MARYALPLAGATDRPSLGRACPATEAKVLSYEPSLIDELVRRIVDIVEPVSIVLFGSAARGEMGANSDIDVMVVMPDGTHRRRTAQELYRSLWGFGFGKDIVVVTEGDVQKERNNPYLVIKAALDEGREVYRAAG